MLKIKINYHSKPSLCKNLHLLKEKMLNPSIHLFSIHREPIDHQAVGAEDKAGKTFSLRFFPQIVQLCLHYWWAWIKLNNLSNLFGSQSRLKWEKNNAREWWNPTWLFGSCFFSSENMESITWLIISKGFYKYRMKPKFSPRSNWSLLPFSLFCDILLQNLVT